MIKLEKKHIKIFSVLIALVFVGSVVAVGAGVVGLLQPASKDASMRIKMILDDDLDICAP